MSANKQDLLLELVIAREQLQKVQARVTELESELFEDRPALAVSISNDDRYHRVLDNLLEGAEIIGFDWRYLYVNDTIAGHGRQPKDVLLRSKVIELYPGIENTELFARLRLCMEERIPQHFETEFVFPDGTATWFELRVQPIPEGIFILSLDITERKQSELAIQRYVKRMEILHQIDLSLIQGDSVQKLVELALSHLLQLIPCQRIDVSILDEQNDEALVFAVVAAGETKLSQGVRVPIPPDIFEGYDTRHTRIFDDIRLIQETRAQAKRLVDEGLLSALNILLLDGEHPLGVLGLFADMPGFFTPEPIEIAVEVASQLAIAIRQMRLAEKLEQHAVLLEQRVTERTAELQSAKEHVEAILNNSGDGILLVRADHKIQQTNTAFNRLFACKNDDYFDQPLTTLLHTEVSALLTSTLQTDIAEGQVVNIEVRAHRQDATEFDAELSISFIKNDGFVCTIRDITERKRVQNKLAEERNLLRTLIDSLPEFIYVKDLQHRFILTNAAHAQARGAVSVEDLIGKTDFDFFSANLAEEFRLEEETIFRTGIPLLNHEEMSLGHAGGFVWALSNKVPLRNIQGEMIGLVGITRDLTERKAQERQLRYHASLQENVSDAVIVTDMEFRIQSWNRAAERIYGWKAEEVTGKSSAEILRTEFSSLDKRDSSVQQLRTQGWWQGEVFQHHKNDNLVAILGSVTLIKDENGAPFSVVAVNHDITERRRADEVLQKSAAEIHDLYNNAPCGYHSVDGNGIILQINDTELGWLGYNRDEVVNRLNITDIFTSESVTIFQKNFPLFKERGWVNDLEFDLLRKDGSTLHILLSATAVYDDAGNYLRSRSSLFDITELRRAQMALAESETRFRVLIEAAPIAKVVSNQAGIITMINGKTESLFGYKRSELIGQPVEILLPEYAREQHVGNRAGYIAAPRMRQMGIGLELSARRKDGSEFPVEIELSYAQIDAGLHVIAFVADISERKRTAAELDRQRTFLRQVIDVSPSLIFVKDYDGRFILVNPMVASMYNTTMEALTGKTEAEFNRSEQEVQNVLEVDRQVIITGEPVFLEEQFTSGSGEVRWLQTTKVQIVSLDGNSKYVLGVAADITERKRAEEVLQQALAKEKELNELKSRFVSMASHEFRTPLATILALTETLTMYRHRLSEEQIEDKFRKIKDQIGHLKDIMEDVLLLARLQARRAAFNPVILNLDALCRSVLDEFQSQPDLTHTLVYSCDPALHRVRLDKKLIRQAINNLVSNAIKYSSKHSTVKIDLKYIDGALLLSIQDEGIGIPAEDIAHLFDPFYRAGNVGAISGTGLGLVITREAVELHGGTITVDSQLNQGTTLTIRIPLSSTGENDHDENTRD